MDPETVRSTFRQPEAVAHYRRNAAELGLWRSEEKLIRHLFREDETLLDLGCGAGRVAIGLWELGYRHVLGIDYSPEMIREARLLAARLECGIAWRLGDATGLELDDGAVDGVVFSFNGLMQIPGRKRRRHALTEIRRVLRAGGAFLFTTHDREHRSFREFLKTQEWLWSRGEQPPGLEEFGDNFFHSPEGDVFMHLPDRGEILEDLEACGWTHESDAMRCEIAQEPVGVRRFSDECRFWVARKPA